MITPQEMRLRLGNDPSDDAQDPLIALLLEGANAYARAYCRLRDYEDVPDHLIIQMTQEDYGRLEGAGISSATLSGAAEHYRSSYSDDVMGALRALRHPGTVRRGTHA